MEFVNHPLVKQGVVERRQYQEEISRRSRDENLLVVLPTGLGKTVIALLAIADHLATFPDRSCLLLAPTRPLVHQHFRFLSKNLALPEGDLGFLTGEDPQEERAGGWARKVVCSTPQVAVNDAERGTLKMDRFSLVVFDEAHRSVGNHAYAILSSKLPAHTRILGITASLPGDEERIGQIRNILRIERVELREDASKDVRPYIKGTEVEWLRVDLTPLVSKIRDLLKSSLDSRLKVLSDVGLIRPSSRGRTGLAELLAARGKIRELPTNLRASLIGSIRLSHAVNLVETQNISSFIKFFERGVMGKKGAASRSLLNDPSVKEAYEAARGAVLLGVEHPKLDALKRALSGLQPGERAMVFTSFRDSVEDIRDHLLRSGIRAGVLVGRSGARGQSQKEQIRALDELRKGGFDVLVATQVGEEGLDVAECRLVVFYDNVSSAVRFVQRRGRTGRASPGRMVVIMARGTKDEAYYWIANRRMEEVKRIASRMSRASQTGPLDLFLESSSRSALESVEPAEVGGSGGSLPAE